MISVTVTDTDRIAGLIQANAALTQRVVDLEIVNAALRRMLLEMEAFDVARKGQGKDNIAAVVY